MFTIHWRSLKTGACGQGTSSFPYDEAECHAKQLNVEYKEPKPSVFHRVLFKLWPFYMIKKMLGANTNTIETLRLILFKDIACIRINEAFPGDEYETDQYERNHWGFTIPRRPTRHEGDVAPADVKSELEAV